MKIALVQFETKIGQDFSKVSKRVINFIQKAKKKNCDLICFPEEFWFGPLDYYPNTKIEEIVSKITPRIINFFQEQAKNYSINIIPGSFIVKENNHYFNQTFIINKKGKIVLTHKKQKLVPFGFEGKNVMPGKSDLKVIKIDGIKIGVLICRELFYSYLFKELREKGAEIILIPSFWSKRSSDYLRHNLKNKIKVWSEMKVIDALCQARAFENEVAICFCNASGRLKDKNEFDVLAGRTQVCIPFYGCIKNLKQNKEGMIVFNFDKSIIEDARKAYRLFE
jgi:predicted amidohydrolase